MNTILKSQYSLRNILFFASLIDTVGILCVPTVWIVAMPLVWIMIMFNDRKYQSTMGWSFIAWVLTIMVAACQVPSLMIVIGWTLSVVIITFIIRHFIDVMGLSKALVIWFLWVSQYVAWWFEGMAIVPDGWTVLVFMGTFIGVARVIWHDQRYVGWSRDTK